MNHIKDFYHLELETKELENILCCANFANFKQLTCALESEIMTDINNNQTYRRHICKEYFHMLCRIYFRNL